MSPTSKPRIKYTLWNPPKYSVALSKATGAFFLQSDLADEIHAIHKGEVIGVFRFRVRKFKSGRILLQASGTKVAPRYRNQGIASKMWKKAIETSNPTHISVITVSNTGEGLVRSLRQKYRNIDWME